MRFLWKLIVLIVLVLIAFCGWVWSGAYDIGADAPHWSATRHVIHTLRERSIETRAAAIRVPDLTDPALLREGAEHYAAMCTGCHLAPGMEASELREGLYPRPPNLTRLAPDPAEAFWVIKHGVKMTAMPAWGKTHSDQKIWAMVAYLQAQPTLSEMRYHELSGIAARHHGEAMDGAEHAAEHAAMHAAMHPAPAASVPGPAPATSAPEPATR